MTSVTQILRQAEVLKESITDTTKAVSETWVVRQRLEDLYKKLLLLDLEYALDKKVEQDLWNFAFKNNITGLQTQTKDRQNLKRGETQATLNLFLETASGFYLQLFQLICTTFKLDFAFRRKSACYGIIKEKIPMKGKIVQPKKSSCYYVCQYCLVHLGDIARYRQQIDQAQTYYWHAANLVPFNGQPYNQLAIVEAAKGNKLSTVFYYIRSLAVRHPFPAAATNLEKLYTKLVRDMNEHKGKLSVSEMITAFLQFHAAIHLCTELETAQKLSLKLIAALPAHITSQSFPSSILVQIVAINIFAMHHAIRQMHGIEERTEIKGSLESLGSEEQQAFDSMFNFTISIFDVLLQYTPKQEQKLKEFFTLPAVKLLLDWLKLNPKHLVHSTLKTSGLWGNLCKVLNNISVSKTDTTEIEGSMARYQDLPLPEDTELRCFQYLEKAHSSYSYSRLPSDGLPLDVECHLRCFRLLAHGKWIAEEHSNLNLLKMNSSKTGKYQFSSPVVQPPGESVSVPEKKSQRQNVAIQAIMQKKNIQSQENRQSTTPSSTSTDKVHDKPSTAVMDPSSSQSTALPSPKYLLGIPTSEPIFLKPGTVRQQPQSVIRGVVNPPPRIQKQILAQQQAAQSTLYTNPDQRPTLWTEDSPKQTKKQITETTVAQSASQGQPKKKTLWQDPETKTSNRSRHQQADSGQGRKYEQPVAKTTDSFTEKMPQETSIKAPAFPHPPFPGMQSDFRYPSGFPNTSQPPPRLQSQTTNQGHPQTDVNSQQLGPNQVQPSPPTQFQTTTMGNNPFRFPPPALGNPSQPPPRMPFAGFPSALGVQQQQGRGDENMMAKDLKHPPRENSLEVGFPGLFQSFDKDFPVPTSAQQQTVGNRPFERFSNANANLQTHQRVGKFQQYPGNVGPRSSRPDASNFPSGLNMERPTLSQGHMPLQQPSQQSSSNMAPQQQPRPNLSFPQNPPFNYIQQFKEQHPGAGNSSNLQQGYSGNMLSPMTGKQNVAAPPYAANPLMKPDKFSNVGVMGSFTQIAVQPPSPGEENLTEHNRLPSAFQGHAEGTPKPESSPSPNRSPHSTHVKETRTANSLQELGSSLLLSGSPGRGTPYPPHPGSVQFNPQNSSTGAQQGTYSLFSSSPWSVPLSSADPIKSLGSSPFSSEASSMRNSPDPGADNPEMKVGMDLGLRFNLRDEQWQDRPKMGNEPGKAPGPGPYFPGPLQSIWSSAGPSPLERLLEMQRQRQNDPH